MRILISILIVLISAESFARGNYSGTVKNVRVDRDGKGIIHFDGNLGDAPASCIDAGFGAHMSFDMNTEGGKAIYSLALSAAASGKKVHAVGTGSCDGYGIVEAVSYIHLIRE